MFKAIGGGSSNVYLDEATGGDEGGSGAGSSELDIASTVDSLAAEIGLTGEGSAISSSNDGKDPTATKETTGEDSTGTGTASKGTGTADDKGTEGTVAQPTGAGAPPKSWRADMHGHFAKLPPEVQTYITQRETEVAEGFKQYAPDRDFAKSIRDQFAPVRETLQRMGVSEAQAVKEMLATHGALSQGDMSRRQQAALNVLKHYGIDPKVLAEGAAQAQPEDPRYKELEQKVGQLTAAQQQEQNARMEALKSQTEKDVQAFAADPTHPYFDECAEHIVKLITAGYTLKDAYETAVYANPVTRAKETSRLAKEAEEKVRKDAKEQAEKARKARGTHVRGSESSRSPQEPLGSLDDTLNETLATIRSRT